MKGQPYESKPSRRLCDKLGEEIYALIKETSEEQGSALRGADIQSGGDSWHERYRIAGEKVISKYKRDLVALEGIDADELLRLGMAEDILVGAHLQSSHKTSSMKQWTPSFSVMHSGFLSYSTINAAGEVLRYIKTHFGKPRFAASTKDELLDRTQKHLQDIISGGRLQISGLSQDIKLVPKDAAGRFTAAYFYETTPEGHRSTPLHISI